MLVLTRKCQEKIQIGENITITIVRVKGQSVRVGIEAPREMKVLRTELPTNAPSTEAAASEAVAASAAGSRSRSGRSCQGANRAAGGNEPSGHDGGPQAAVARQPLSQYIPAMRLAAVACPG